MVRPTKSPPPGEANKKPPPEEGRLFPKARDSIAGSVLRQLVAVVLRVQLARLVAVVLRVEVMGARDVGVVRGLFVVARRVRLCRRVVVPGCVLMVLCRVPVMVDLFFV